MKKRNWACRFLGIHREPTLVDYEWYELIGVKNTSKRGKLIVKKFKCERCEREYLKFDTLWDTDPSNMSKDHKTNS